MFKRNELQAALKIKGMTEVEFAESIGISPTTLYKRYKDGGNFKYHELQKAHLIFGDESFWIIFFS